MDGIHPEIRRLHCITLKIAYRVDSSAFNDIIRAFLNMAVLNADIDEEARDKVRGQLRWIFDEKQASEVLNQYLK